MNRVGSTAILDATTTCNIALLYLSSYPMSEITKYPKIKIYLLFITLPNSDLFIVTDSVLQDQLVHEFINLNLLIHFMRGVGRYSYYLVVITATGLYLSITSFQVTNHILLTLNLS